MIELEQEQEVDTLKVARANAAAFKYAYDHGHSKWVGEADLYERFFSNDQWDAKDLEELNKLKRPALSLNMIRPTVSAILGEYINKRASFQFKPRTEGDQQVADVLTKVMMQICDQNNYDHVERTVFMDGVITDRGFFDVRMDYADNQQGDIKITALDPFDVVIDPQGKEYDPTTWREVSTTRWMSIDDIADAYGEELAEQAKNNALARGFANDFVEYYRDSTFGSVENGYANAAYTYDQIPSAERQVRRIRVIDRQYYKVDRSEFLVDPVTGDETRIPKNWDDDRILAYRTMTGAQQVVKTERRVHWTVTAADIVLHDDWSPYETFTVVPYFPMFRRGKPLGIVRDLIDPQKQVNKLYSQSLHIVNSTANSGWQMEDGALINMTPEDLARDGAKTGLVVVTAPGKSINKIQPNQIPTGITTLAQTAGDFIRRISGVSEYMVGEGSTEVSGVALDARINRNLSMLQPIFDSLDYTRSLLARKVLSLIQRYYTDTRMFRVTAESETGQATSEVIAVNAPTHEGTIVNDLTVGKYDVVATSQPSRASFVETQFAQLIQMAQAGIQVPPDVMIEASNLARKSEIAERIRQQMGMGQPTPEMQQQMQMQQQAEMQKFMLEMQKMQAQIEELMSQAELNRAKAMAEVDGRVAELQAQDNKTKAMLAAETMKNETKMAITGLQAQAGKLRESQAQTGRFNQTQSMTTTATGGRNN